MSNEELEEYEQQLKTVEESLQLDPDNESLNLLKSEITDLIALLRQTLEVETFPVESTGGSEKANSLAKDSGNSTHTTTSKELNTKKDSNDQETSETKNAAKYAPGDQVLARWISGDKQYYSAKITSVTGSSQNPVYTVVFPDHGSSTDTVGLDSIRPFNGPYRPAQVSKFPHTGHTTNSSNSGHTKRINEGSSFIDSHRSDGIRVQGSRISKDTKPMSKAEVQRQALDSGKMKWQAFAKKGVKMGKGLKAKKIGEDSMFKSPDSATGKVGVIGSGKGMTRDQPLGKHKFDNR